MPTLSHPSEQFPGPPSVTLEVPDGWVPVRVPGTLLAARASAVAEGFAPHVVVRGFSRDRSCTMGRIVGELRDAVLARRDGEIDEPFTVDLGAVPFVGVSVSWTDERIGTVVQTHLFAGARRSGLVELVQVAGSVAGADLDAQYGALQEVMQTVRVTR